MDDRDKYLNRLRLAEHQFRLACTVHLAVVNGVQTLDVPVEWTFGKHRVSYKDFGLRNDQAGYAALHLEMTATFVLAAAIRDAIVGLFANPKTDANPSVIAAYQISRLIRNAFAHSMLYPVWSIDYDCRAKTFAIDKVIALNTGALHGKPLEWPDYGGPLAMFYFGRFVRETLLDDKVDPNRSRPPFPSIECYQQGRLIARRIEEIPSNATEIASAGPGGIIDLGEGYRLHVTGKMQLFK